MDLTRICPISDEPIKAIILTWPNNNTGTIVVCDVAAKSRRCPLGKKYSCLFWLNPEKKYAVCDPRSNRK